MKLNLVTCRSLSLQFLRRQHNKSLRDFKKGTNCSCALIWFHVFCLVWISSFAWSEPWVKTMDVWHKRYRSPGKTVRALQSKISRLSKAIGQIQKKCPTLQCSTPTYKLTSLAPNSVRQCHLFKLKEFQSNLLPVEVVSVEFSMTDQLNHLRYAGPVNCELLHLRANKSQSWDRLKWVKEALERTKWETNGFWNETAFEKNP